mmetsp:Transcript_6815/g.11265  ORF Transcript_6815/g.11265 Transcript_6815/m.11265 type:complete len:153 (+) Transcript_6815:175-633(+)
MGCERGGSDFRGTGIAGVVLFTILFAIALLGSVRSFTDKGDTRIGWFSKKNYFVAVTVMAFLDLFRFYMMAIDDAYKCSSKTWVYGIPFSSKHSQIFSKLLSLLIFLGSFRTNTFQPNFKLVSTPSKFVPKGCDFFQLWICRTIVPELMFSF